MLKKLCNEHPGKPELKEGKVGFTGVYIIPLILAQKKKKKKYIVGAH